jgi:hypothetical protein
MRNRGELAEGWYDPSTLQKAIASTPKLSATARDVNPREQSHRPREEAWREEQPRRGMSDSSSDSEDSVGPVLPGKASRSRASRVGPSIPNMDDLELQKGFMPSSFCYS